MAAVEAALRRDPRPDVAALMQRFHRFGATPAVETYLALFRPTAPLFDDGMERPLTVDEIPAHIEGGLAMAPGFRMTPERWQARGATLLFIEWEGRGGFACVERFDVRDGLVLSGRLYRDSLALQHGLEGA